MNNIQDPDAPAARRSVLKAPANNAPSAPPPPPRLQVPTNFSEINLEQELLHQFTKAKQLLEDAEFDDNVPHNQKVQNVNSVNTIITNIINQQEKVYNIERMKKLEDCLIATLQKFPDLKDDFLAAYKGALNG